MWVKICANTTLEDTQLAIDCGADAVGFVFARSKRQVTPGQVAEITADLSSASCQVERVGVFQDAAFAEIEQTVRVASLTGVQLHSAPDLPLIARLRQAFGRSVTITQTLHWTIDSHPGLDSQVEHLTDRLGQLFADGEVDRVLLDNKVGSNSGGTGTNFDWKRAREIFQKNRKQSLILAGGLKPENIREAVQQLTPWGVDVASGVEQMPGKKAPKRVRLFLEAARTAAKPPAV